MTEKKKTFSCPSLHHAVYLAPDELRHCCKRFFVNGKMEGDVRIFKIKDNSDITADKIRLEKKKLHDDINKGKKTPCSGCPYLTKDYWPELKELQLNNLSIETHTVCNMKCTYCSEVYYGGLKASYDAKKVIEELNKYNKSDNLEVSWGGGEPVLMHEFDKVFVDLNEKLKPKNNFIFSNSTKYSNAIEKYLSKGKATLTTSIDAGTVEVFKKIRGIKGMHKVFDNLEKYNKAAKKGIIIKYVLTKENSTNNELNSFIELIKKHKLLNCSFQISSNYKDEKLSNELLDSAIKLYMNLLKQEVESVFFDYHLKPRLKYKLKEAINSDENINHPVLKNINKFDQQKNLNIIIWGAGQTARQVIQDSPFFEDKKVKVAFFVDSDKSKVGTYIDKIEIKSPDKIKEFDYPIMIASSLYYKNIIENLKSLGISKNRIMSSLFF